MVVTSFVLQQQQKELLRWLFEYQQQQSQTNHGTTTSTSNKYNNNNTTWSNSNNDQVVDVAGVIDDPTTKDREIDNEDDPTKRAAATFVQNFDYVTFFTTWISHLSYKLMTVLPDLDLSSGSSKIGNSTSNRRSDTIRSNDYRDACQLIVDRSSAKRDAIKVRDTIAQQTPIDQRALDEANRVVQRTTKEYDHQVNVTQTLVQTTIFQRSDMQRFLSIQQPSSSMSDRSCSNSESINSDTNDTNECYDDDDLITYVILKQSTPSKLAAWCEQDVDQAQQLLLFLITTTTAESSSNTKNNNLWCCHVKSTGSCNDTNNNSKALKRLFLQGGGARNGCYPRAVQIYYQLSNGNNEHTFRHDDTKDDWSFITSPTVVATASPSWNNTIHFDSNHNNNEDVLVDSEHEDTYSTEGTILHRLRVAAALELCADDYTMFGNVHTKIDPFRRYVHYEQSYLVSKLTGGTDEVLQGRFDTLSVWELRHVINSDATEDELSWGRISLQNYRPDIIYDNTSGSANVQWQYCYIVRSDVAYTDVDWYVRTGNSHGFSFFFIVCPFFLFLISKT
jgi:hypothetical protein